jgi:hypothetical protein
MANEVTRAQRPLANRYGKTGIAAPSAVLTVSLSADFHS